MTMIMSTWGKDHWKEEVKWEPNFFEKLSIGLSKQQGIHDTILERMTLKL